MHISDIPKMRPIQNLDHGIVPAVTQICQLSIISSGNPKEGAQGMSRMLTYNSNGSVQHFCICQDLWPWYEAFGNIKPHWLDGSKLVYKTSKDGHAEEQDQDLRQE